MGCDIHAYIEHRNPKADGEWWNTFGGRINPGRNYAIFGRLAGVRGDGPAVVEPRGIPETLGWESAYDWWLWIDHEGGADRDDSCTPEEAEQYQRSGSKVRGEITIDQWRTNAAHFGKPRWVEHPDWHTPSWVTPDEWQEALTGAWGDPTEYRAMLAAMRVLEQAGNVVRVVFWFDN